jgi:hypothetical protein
VDGCRPASRTATCSARHTDRVFCTGEYSPTTEAGISPFSDDLDWSMCAPDLKQVFDQIAASTDLVTDKDRNGYSLRSWEASPLSDNFLYSRPR